MSGEDIKADTGHIRKKDVGSYVDNVALAYTRYKTSYVQHAFSRQNQVLWAVGLRLGRNPNAHIKSFRRESVTFDTRFKNALNQADRLAANLIWGIFVIWRMPNQENAH